jgi:hypothetical protein
MVTALLAGYFFVRFVVFDVGTPGLELREAGFGFVRYTGAEIAHRFGGNPLPFYAYNVAASILAVLFAEPRDGVWALARGIVHGDLHPAVVIAVVSNTLATLVVFRFAWTRRHVWLARRFERRDQIVLLFGMVLVANAVISYPYTKDAIVSPAGVFFAAAAFVGCVDLVETLPQRRRLASIGVTAVLAVLSLGWAMRFVGLHAALDRTAFVVRQQWTRIDEIVPRWRETLTPAELGLKRQLQDEAVRWHPSRPQIREEWTRFFDIE